jgi:uncharacterized membrane protein
MKDEFCRNRPGFITELLSRDSRGRTLAKTVVYRVVAIALLAGITYYYTGSAGEATTITVLFNVVGTVAYYGLERLWEYVLWGRARLGSSSSDVDGKSADPIPGGPRAVPVPSYPRTDSEATSAK